MSQLISAICTPLHDDLTLDSAALEAHIDDQWQNGIGGLLVAGSMGLMQLQSERTYRNLVEQSVCVSRQRGEIMIGVGDTSFARTRDRIQLVERLDIDGVVVLSPYLVKFSQAELISYFQALAAISSKPLYLYDLPSLTGTRLELETVVVLAQHSNIKGIKCSVAWEDTSQLRHRLGSRFRIIPAQPHLIDQLIRIGVKDNLDGIFSVAPHLSIAIARAADDGDWTRASVLQGKLSQLLQLLRVKYEAVLAGCEVILNARGIKCRLTCAPMRQLTEVQRNQLLSEPLVQEVVSGACCSISEA